jgi:hypothetical protein
VTGKPLVCREAVSNSNPLGSLKIGDVRAWILALRRGALLTWQTQMDKAKHVLLGREVHGGTALWGA